jgi:UDP-N-acetylglucosamine--N-acetylmuramyl-(pentapeptide) pyrophosphoryl-undecaprenol N-acetylglucosamine transferase
MNQAQISDPGASKLGSAALHPLRVLVAASGTGGHLIPALHIVKALEKAAPGSVIEFIGAGRPLEEKIIVGNGYVRNVVASAGIKRRSIAGLLQFLWRFPRGLLQICSLYRRFKPDVVVGVGGYVSVLPVVVARFKGIPTWTHEAELHPGLANRVLAHFADRMSISFADTHIRGRAKTEYTGHPVRPELAAIDGVEMRPGAPSRLLVIGGSQGARGLDQAVSDIAETLAAKGVEVVHQCRPEAIDSVVNAYRAGGVKASVVPFIDDMPGAYGWSDIVISRAGASSVAEIACVNRPAIFVPYPFQQGTHQTDNAKALAARGKALVVEETEPEFGRRLREALLRVLDHQAFRVMKEAPADARGLEAAGRIAQGIVSLVGRQLVAPDGA